MILIKLLEKKYLKAILRKQKKKIPTCYKVFCGNDIFAGCLGCTKAHLELTHGDLTAVVLGGGEQDLGRCEISVALFLAAPSLNYCLFWELSEWNI